REPFLHDVAKPKTEIDDVGSISKSKPIGCARERRADREARLVEIVQNEKANTARMRKAFHQLPGSRRGQARQLLTIALGDRIVVTANEAANRYRLTIPIAFDRMLITAVPMLGLQDMGASPTGFEPVFWP